MPAIAHGGKILVTGANGYVASWVIKALLDQGFHVKGTVRSMNKADALKRYFSSYDNRPEFIVVEDIAKEGAFDEVVDGVDGIMHIASPVISEHDSRSVDDYVIPAVNGTSGILKSAIIYGKRIKRIVITSSSAAIVSPYHHNGDVDEDNWNEDAMKEVREKGDDTSSTITKYCASKTLAEKAAWKIYKDHKDEVGWDLVVINIPLVLGIPLIGNVSSVSEMNCFFKSFWYDTVVAPTSKSSDELSSGTPWVDVRDVAEGHVRALWKESAGNERIIISAGRASNQEWINVVNKITPAPLLSHPLPRGMPELEIPPLGQLDTSKEARILALGYKSMEETATNILNYLSSCGL